MKLLLLMGLLIGCTKSPQFHVGDIVENSKCIGQVTQIIDYDFNDDLVYLSNYVCFYNNITTCRNWVSVNAEELKKAEDTTKWENTSLTACKFN